MLWDLAGDPDGGRRGLWPDVDGPLTSFPGAPLFQ